MIKANSYGKSRVRLVKLFKEGPKHEVKEFSVETELEGDFERSYTHADNSKVVPTDTQKNICLAVAHSNKEWRCAEEYASEVAAVLAAYPQVQKASVRVTETCYVRLHLPGSPAPHPHSFRQAPYKRTARAEQEKSKVARVWGGVRGLTLLKSTGSGFEGYPRCQYTTLKETGDRFFSTTLDAEWEFAGGAAGARSGDALAHKMVLAIEREFAERYSPSVQATLYWAGSSCLAASGGALQEVRLRMPNNHVLGPADLAPLGLPRNQDTYVPVDEPHGTISAVIAQPRAARL